MCAFFSLLLFFFFLMYAWQWEWENFRGVYLFFCSFVVVVVATISSTRYTWNIAYFCDCNCCLFNLTLVVCRSYRFFASRFYIISTKWIVCHTKFAYIILITIFFSFFSLSYAILFFDLFLNAHYKYYF